MYVSLFSQQIIISSDVFNIDDKKNLSSKSAYYTDFWRSCDTEDWSNDDENSASIPEINYMFKYITTENSYFKL